MKSTRFFHIGAWAAVAVLWAACGSTVVGPGAGSGNGGSSSTGCSANPPCCSGAVPDTCCALCDTVSTSVTSGAGGGGAGGSGGAGGGSTCGGFPGTACSAGEFCSFPDKQCGGNDGSGSCQPKPGLCPLILAPVCGCDGHVYDNDCEANVAGVDINDNGGCTPPPGDFACGARFCQLGQTFCQIDASESGPPTFSCQILPSSCGVTATCGCLPHASCPGSCGWSCSPVPGGGLDVTCCH